LQRTVVRRVDSLQRRTHSMSELTSFHTYGLWCDDGYETGRVFIQPVDAEQIMVWVGNEGDTWGVTLDAAEADLLAEALVTWKYQRTFG
jgi:hypothetical protein